MVNGSFALQSYFRLEGFLYFPLTIKFVFTIRNNRPLLPIKLIFVNMNNNIFVSDKVWNYQYLSIIIFVKLGQWLSWQRRKKKKGIISQEEIKRLESIGMVWSVKERR